MMKKRLLSTTLAAAALASTPLLADPGHRQGQNAPCAGAACPAAGTGEHAGRHGMQHGGGHGQMHATRGANAGKGHHGQRGNAGENCPMHGERKPT